MTLVVGPFLILVIFGLGYRTDTPFRTMLVLGEQAQLALDRQDLGEAFADAISLQGTSSDESAARQMLESGEVDLLIVAPKEPVASLRSGEQAVFRVIHGEIDPVLKSNIRLVARLSVDAINRQVLADVIEVAQEGSEEVEDPLQDLRETASQLVAALEAGDRGEADAHLAQLRDELSAAEETTAAADSLFSSVATALGTTEGVVLASISASLEGAESDDIEASAEAAREIETSIQELEAGLVTAQGLDPGLLVNPFRAELEEANVAPTQPGIFYSPATIVVLIQHLAVTFAALSVVRERQLGLTAVFRASPLGSSEALVGKYLGFGVIGLIVAAGLTLAVMALGIAIQGSMAVYTVAMALLVLSSLGLGFVLSGVSRTDTQAVQYAMITLLISIFFTGFILPLEQLIPAVQVVSYLIPATYGIMAVHDVVFRGGVVQSVALGGLVLYTFVMAVGAWWVIRGDVQLTARSRWNL